MKNAGQILLVFALFISTIGSTASTFGFISYVYAKTSSPFNTGLVTMTGLIAGLLIGPFLGVLAKRLGPFTTLPIPEYVSALLLLFIPLIDQPAMVYAVAFFLGINIRLVGISRMSIIPLLTEREKLMQFNAYIRVVNRGAMILGALLYGIIVNYSVAYIFYFNAVTYLISGILLTGLSIRNRAGLRAQSQEASQSSFGRIVQQLVEGFRISYLDWRVNAIVFLGITSRLFFTSMPLLLLIFIKRDLSLSDREFGFVQTLSQSVSFVVFVILAGTLQRRISMDTRLLVFTCFSLYGLAVVSISLVQSIGSLYVLFSIAELIFFTAVIVVHTYVQQAIPSDQLPLASGAVGTGFSAASLVSLLVFMSLAEHFDAAILIMTIGIGLVLSAMLYGIYCKFAQIVLANSQPASRRLDQKRTVP